MKYLTVLFILISLIMPFQVQAQSGDIAFWLPQTGNTHTPEAQVKRNEEYFSIKLHSVFAYYRSGFLENVNKLIVVSDTEISADNKPPIRSTMVNKSWQKLDKEGDFIGVNDHLVTLSPATISNIKIKISYRGIGEDKFNFLFEALSDPTLKTALSLSPGTSATISAIAPTVQKLLASPYTANDPRQILDISQSYLVYADTLQLKTDSFREGYLVIVSSREGKSEDLRKVISLDTKDIRLSPSGIGLEYMEGTEWKQFRHNSYVVLSITKTSIRGENEYSNWFSKYTEAERIAEEKLLEGESTDKVKQEAIGVWREGNALLYIDPDYLQSERVAIKSKHLNVLQSVFTKWGTSKAKLDAKTLGVPTNFTELAQKYEEATVRQSSQITVRVEGTGGNPLSNTKFRLSGLDAFGAWATIKTTNEDGEFTLKGLSPGKYKIEREGVFGAYGAFIVDPKDKKEIDFKLK